MLVWADKTEDGALDTTRQALVLSDEARGMVRSMARRFAHHRQDLADYEMAGTTGLIVAAQRFDPSRPLTRATLAGTFAAFAYVYALREMRMLAYQEQIAPVHAMEYAARLARQGEDVGAVGVTQSDVEQARTLGMRPETVSRQRRSIAAGDTRQVVAPDDALDRVAHAPSPETLVLDDLDRAAVRDSVRSAIDKLPSTLRRVMELALDGHGRRAIADRLGVSERSVGNYMDRAHAQLRAMLAEFA